MYPTRAIALSTLFCGVLCMPLFVSAQATPPPQTQAELDAEAAAAREAAMNDPLVQDAIKKAAKWEKTATEEAAAAKELGTKTMEDAKKLQKDYDKFIEEKTKEIMLSPAEIQKKVLSDYLDVKISPGNPGPSEFVSITIESYLTDLKKATIKWSLNGKVVSQGLGKMIFGFQNGLSGETTRVSVSIITNAGDTAERDFSFTPVGATILWEANTYTPPFYKGKALMVPQAKVRVVAVPNIGSSATPFSAGNFVYTWEKNSFIDEGASGYGKNIFSFTGPTPFNDMDVRVNVSSLDDTMNSELRVNIPLSRPLILFYEKHPLLGVLYNKPLGDDFNLDKKEFSVNAEPYFFSNEESEYETIKYNWSVNGDLVQSFGRTLTLRNDRGEKGESAVSLAMRGIKQTFQNAKKELTVRFGDEESVGRPTF